MNMIIALQESGEAELQETQGTAGKKRQYDRAKAEDVRLKAMEKLSETKKRGSSAVSYTHLTLPTKRIV